MEEDNTQKEEKELTKAHWEDSKRINQALILQNEIQTEMAKRIIILCDEKIKEFKK
jgi:hypothetical protein